MICIDIKISALGDPPTFPELTPFLKGEAVGFSILEAGMQSGATSTALHIKLDDGTNVTVEISASMFLSMAGAVRGACHRFGDTKNA